MKSKKVFAVAVSVCLIAVLLFSGCSVVGKIQGVFDGLFSGKGGGGGKQALRNDFEAEGYVVTFLEVPRGQEEAEFGYDLKGMLLDNFTPSTGYDFFFVKIVKLEKDGVEQDMFAAFENIKLSKIYCYEDGVEVNCSLSISNEEKGYISLVLTFPSDHADEFDVEIKYDVPQEEESAE